MREIWKQFFVGTLPFPQDNVRGYAWGLKVWRSVVRGVEEISGVVGNDVDQDVDHSGRGG